MAEHTDAGHYAEEDVKPRTFSPRCGHPDNAVDRAMPLSQAIAEFGTETERELAALRAQAEELRVMLWILILPVMDSRPFPWRVERTGFVPEDMSALQLVDADGKLITNCGPVRETWGPRVVELANRIPELAKPMVEPTP